MQHRPSITLGLVLLIVLSCSSAWGEYIVRIDPATKELYFIIISSKGNIRFNHERHQSRMKTESCLPCHKTPTPTKEHTMTRFDQRGAHSFCKGCHRESGKGPVECHECHNNKK